MKKFFFLVVGLILSVSALYSQTEDRWENLADRLSEKAERLAEAAERNANRIEYLAEKNASKWEAQAEHIASQFERKWNRDWNVRFEKNPGYRSVVIAPDGVFLGIEANEISSEKARKLGFENSYGSYVSRVIENTAAKAAGLQPFDYIYGVNEQRTSDNQNLTDILEDYEPGTEVTLHFIRKGQKMTAKVSLGSDENQDWDFEEEDPGFLGVSPHDEEAEDDMDGVTVEIVEASTAQEIGLKDGDIITQINGYPILDWEDVTTAVRNTSPGDQIEIRFSRNGNEMQGKGTVKSYGDVYPDDENEDWDVDVDWDEMGDVDIRLDDETDFEWDGKSDDRAFLGIYIEMISENKASKLGFDNPYGSYVGGVMKNTAAEKAGIKSLDYIYGIDEYRVGENQNLGGILKKYKPGDKATVHFIRKEKKMSASLTFGKHSEAEKVSRNSCEDPFFGIVQAGSSDSEGIKVNPVENTTAKDLGLQDGDVITHINGYKMIDWTDVTLAIGMLNPGETIAVEYLRDGKKMKGSKAIKSYAETKNCKDCDCGKKDNVTIKIDDPVNFEFRWKDDKSSAGEVSTPRIDIAKAQVAMENVTSGEESTLKGKGINLPQQSTLTVNNLRLTPNQGQGLFSLNFNLPSSGKTVVKVYNIAGRAIYEYDLGRFSGEFADSIDISQNGPGDYFLQITQDDKVFTKKIVLTSN